MVELGCQDTDWVSGNDRGFRCDFTPGGSHTSHLGMDKGKWGCVGCVSGWVGALRVAPRVTDG